LIFKTQPHALRSNEQVTVEFILQHTDFTELLDALTEEKVLKLTFKGMRELASDLEKKMSFNLFKTESDLEKAVRIIEKRNLIVHHRGIVNRLYLSRTKDQTVTPGQTLELNHEIIREELHFLQNNVLSIDHDAGIKFGIARKEEQPVADIPD
jgi:hypothetical protein